MAYQLHLRCKSVSLDVGNEGGVEIERTWVIEVISVLEGKLQVFRPMLPIEAILGYT